MYDTTNLHDGQAITLSSAEKTNDIDLLYHSLHILTQVDAFYTDSARLLVARCANADVLLGLSEIADHVLSNGIMDNRVWLAHVLTCVKQYPNAEPYIAPITELPKEAIQEFIRQLPILQHTKRRPCAH